MRAAIVLAAGQSRRFGDANKLVACYRGRPLLHHALAAACAAPVGRVVVVTGSDGRVARAARAFGCPRVRIVRRVGTRKRRQTLAAGLEALRPIEREAFVFLGDMPWVAPSLARRLIVHGRRSGALRPTWRGRPGHPVLLQQPREALKRLRRGEAPFARIDTIGGNRAATLDIDRPGALRQPGILR